MELLFRKYFWAVNLAFILIAALLAARTVNLFVEDAIAPSPIGNGTKVASRPHLAEAITQLNLEKLAKLSGLKLPEPELAGPDVKEPPKADLNAEPVKSGMRVKLLGTLLAGMPEWSISSIQDMVTSKVETYMIGDKIQGADVIDIERQRVIILNNGRKEFIDGEPGTGAEVAMLNPPPTMHHDDSPPPSVALGQGVKAVDENHYLVPRSEIDKTLSNLNDVAMQARIVPAFKDGKAEGFKLFSIRPDSIYSKIGVQNGDVIRRINGYDLNSPEKALEIYSKLKEANRIDIELDRNGTTVQKTYTIQ